MGMVSVSRVAWARSMLFIEFPAGACGAAPTHREPRSKNRNNERQTTSHVGNHDHAGGDAAAKSDFTIEAFGHAYAARRGPRCLYDAKMERLRG